jgi:signal transduction histidine kinase
VQTEKLASLGQLTAGIAHEIKNPLNLVNNFAALSVELVDELDDVLKPAALDNKTREGTEELTQMLKGNLEKVVQHGQRADSIVKNMLLHSREGSGKRSSVDLNTIVEDSLNLAYHGARAEKQEFNIRLERSFDPAAGVVDLFPQEITRVLLNLISNGVYSRPGPCRLRERRRCVFSAAGHHLFAKDRARLAQERSARIGIFGARRQTEADRGVVRCQRAGGDVTGPPGPRP